jgi:diphthamide biosynthesis protein 4
MRFSMLRKMQIMKKFVLVTNSNQRTSERFLKVQKAWEILSDSSSRLLYDKELQRSRRDALPAEVAEDLSLHS